MTGWTQRGADFLGPTSNDNLGYSVAVNSDGTRIAIGVPRGAGGGSQRGFTQVFDWNGTTWTQVGSNIDGVSDLDRAGHAVAFSSDASRLVIGTPFDDGAGNQSGLVQVFDWNGTTWTQVGSDLPGGTTSNEFGRAVAISADGSRIIAGAPNPSSANGYVEIYDYNGSTWTLVGSRINGEAANDRFGQAVAMSSDGSRVAVGGFLNDGTTSSSNVGHVRVFDYNGSAWTQVGSDIDGEPVGDTQFGT